MDAVTRSGVAFVAGRLILGEEFVALFDLNRNKDCKFIGPCRNGLVRIRGVEERVEIVCEEKGNALLLFQHTLEYHIDLELEGKRFQGFDEKSEAHFRGWLAGATLYLFDYKDASTSRYLM